MMGVISAHEKFNFKSLDELKYKIEQLGVALPLSVDLDVLNRPVTIGKLTLPNALSTHPMEGADAEPDGSPSELTLRRYGRFAAGGTGLVWMEACAVVPEGKANPRQLQITQENLSAFAGLVQKARRAARDSMGKHHRTALVLQLTHSGRYCKPLGVPRPVIAHHSVILDTQHRLPPDYPLISDEELDHLQDSYVKAAILAAKAGFDGVDIKCCHRYLPSELLASFTRTHSRYGESFENRIRFLTETIAKVRDAVPQLEVTCRLNVFDAIAYPYGFGVNRQDSATADLTEPIDLVGRLSALGVNLLNVSIGNPYYQPHFGRPYDEPIAGGYVPREHPLQGIERLIAVARDIQLAYPSIGVVGTGYSWLRQFLPFVAAGVLSRGWATVVGVGRAAFAYPDLAKDIFTFGRMDPLKCCITCSSCTQIMHDGGRSGCVPRDPEIYAPIFREGRLRNSAVMREKA